ncbi:copper chaperone PCu(A)C [Jannaschia sp.]|nr:copper chaperone PCu(A)C [Jannaschia sp.]
MIRLAAFALALLPTAALADLAVTDAMVPLAPPGVMTHAGFMTIANEGDTVRSLIGVTAEGYAMAHLHLSQEADGVATMTSVDQIDIDPGQSVELAQGGLHVMLMQPKAAPAMGDTVSLILEFADGEMLPVEAKVMKMDHDHDS